MNNNCHSHQRNRRERWPPRETETENHSSARVYYFHPSREKTGAEYSLFASCRVRRRPRASADVHPLLRLVRRVLTLRIVNDSSTAADQVRQEPRLRLKVFALKLVLVFTSVVVTMLGLEAWLAISRVNGKSNDYYIQGKGITYMPGTYYRHTKEGFSEGYINSHGFRDYERTYEKPPNTFR